MATYEEIIKIVVQGEAQAVAALGRLDGAAKSVGQSALHLKNAFGEMLPVIGVAALAAVTQQMFVLGDQVNDTAEAYRQLGGTAQGLSSLQQATRGIVDDMTLMGEATRFLSQGLVDNAQQASQLIGVARDLALAFGKDGTQAVDAFFSAMSTGRVNALKDFGIDIDAVKQRAEELEASGVRSMEAMRRAIVEVGGAIRDNLDIEAFVDDSAIIEAKWTTMVQRLSTVVNNFGELVAGVVVQAITALDQIHFIAGANIPEGQSTTDFLNQGWGLSLAETGGTQSALNSTLAAMASVGSQAQGMGNQQASAAAMSAIGGVIQSGLTGLSTTFDTFGNIYERAIDANTAALDAATRATNDLNGTLAPSGKGNKDGSELGNYGSDKSLLNPGNLVTASMTEAADPSKYLTQQSGALGAGNMNDLAAFQAAAAAGMAATGDVSSGIVSIAAGLADALQTFLIRGTPDAPMGNRSPNPRNTDFTPYSYSNQSNAMGAGNFNALALYDQSAMLGSYDRMQPPSAGNSMGAGNMNDFLAFDAAQQNLDEITLGFDTLAQRTVPAVGESIEQNVTTETDAIVQSVQYLTDGVKKIQLEVSVRNKDAFTALIRDVIRDSGGVAPGTRPGR